MIEYGLLKPQGTYSTGYFQKFAPVHSSVYTPAPQFPTKITAPSKWAARLATDEYGAGAVKISAKIRKFGSTEIARYSGLDKTTQENVQLASAGGGQNLKGYSSQFAESQTIPTPPISANVFGTQPTAPTIKPKNVFGGETTKPISDRDLKQKLDLATQMVTDKQELEKDLKTQIGDIMRRAKQAEALNNQEAVKNLAHEYDSAMAYYNQVRRENKVLDGTSKRGRKGSLLGEPTASKKETKDESTPQPSHRSSVMEVDPEASTSGTTKVVKGSSVIPTKPGYVVGKRTMSKKEKKMDRLKKSGSLF